MRLIDADVLLEKTAELEATALEQVVKYEPSEEPQEWHRWTGILQERTAFKYDLVDAPTVDAVTISFLEELRDKAQNEEAVLMIDEIIAQWEKERDEDA